MANQETTEPSTKRLTTEVADGVHALLGPVNSLIIEGPENGAVLIDSGQDADAGKRIRKALDQLGRTPTALVNTHSHADHFGGNAYLVRRYPALEILAPEFESAIITTPFLEPVYLFHGASPLKELRSKWLQGPPSPVHREIGAGAVEIGGVQLELVDLRGHAHRQLGVRFGDFLFAADGVFGDATLQRYPLPFAQDVSDQLTSFDVLDELAFNGTEHNTRPVVAMLPGHGELTTGSERIGELVQRNRETVQRAAEVVLAACSRTATDDRRSDGSVDDGGASTEDVLAFTARELGLEMNDLPRFHLNLCAVSAYLAHLRRAGRIEPLAAAGRLTWRVSA